jgi:endonuclease YncB( thermonuclease family)
MLLIALILLIGLSVPTGASATTGTESQAFDGWYRLSYVVDGDTIWVQGLNLSVRLAGINAPETTASYGAQATATLKWLLAQPEYPGWVYLQFADPYYDPGTNRYRAHVWFLDVSWGGWVLTQTYLARTGLARVDTGYYASDRYYEHLARMESYAQYDRCGIWGGRFC